jgi:hypothetical protein
MSRSRFGGFGVFGAALLSVLALAADVWGGPVFNGTLYYTRFSGGQNVGAVDYSYDGGTHALTLSNNHNIAAVGGADGIIVAPNGHLLIGGQGSGHVYELTTGGVLVNSVFPGTTESYHMSLNPAGTTAYTSPFGGPLDTIPLSGGGLGGNGTAHSITGGDTGVTQIVFDGNGNSYYVRGNPNGGGTFGSINLSTFQTTRLLNGQTSIHGTQYDPFTGLITFFGDGAVGTYNPSNGQFHQRTGINSDFDQGSLDGHGHAFIAGNGQLTFIDYSATGDITSALNTVIIRSSASGPGGVLGFGGIDDLAPLVGPGSADLPTPAPPALCVFAAGVVAVVGRRWRK